MRAITKKPTDSKRPVRGQKESKQPMMAVLTRHVYLHLAGLDNQFLVIVAVAASRPPGSLDPATVSSRSADCWCWCAGSRKPCMPWHRGEWCCSRPPVQTWRSPVFLCKTKQVTGFFITRWYILKLQYSWALISHLGSFTHTRRQFPPCGEYHQFKGNIKHSPPVVRGKDGKERYKQLCA